MKRICKQCGKEFELSQSEINFYKGKKLSIPKRCKDCRNANKQKKGGLSKADKISKANEDVQSKTVTSYRLRNTQKRSGFAAGICMLAIAVVLAFYAAGKVIPAWIEDEAPVDLPVQSQMETLQEIGAELDSDSSYIPIFRNAKMLDEHFQKHGIEMGFSSAEEYQAAAAAVVNNPDSLHKLEAEDGDDVYYLESTNEFVIVSTDGYIRTYFKPDAGIDYYNRQ